MRMGMAIGIAVVLGVVAGALGAAAFLPDTTNTDQDEALAALQEKLDKVDAKYQDALHAHEQLQQAYRSLKETANQPQLPDAEPERSDVSAYMEEVEAELFGEAPDPQRDDRGRREVMEQSGEDEEERAAREAAMAERRQQWEEYREQRRLDREASFDNAIANAKDWETQERIEAIQNYQDYFGEMRDAMRNTESEEERALLREEMIENAHTYQQLVQTQRDAMLRDIAAQHGITSTAKQDAFIQSYQDLQRDPLFNSGSPGGGWGGGGWGGPGRGRGMR